MSSAPPPVMPSFAALAKRFVPPIMAVSARLGRVALDVLLPPVCPVCYAPIAGETRLCGACYSGLPLIAEPIDPITGRPMPFEMPPDLADLFSLQSPPVYGRARAAAVFADIARDLVHLLKYRDRHDCAPVMATLMARAGRDLLRDADLIVPVPLHRRRLIARRYNQSDLLARHIGKRVKIPVDASALVRSRATRPQVTLTGQERHANVRDAFAVPPAHGTAIAGKRIVLVDDVVTTGATVDASTRALLSAKAYRVDVLAFAIAVGDEKDHIGSNPADGISHETRQQS